MSTIWKEAVQKKDFSTIHEIYSTPAHLFWLLLYSRLAQNAEGKVKTQRDGYPSAERQRHIERWVHIRRKEKTHREMGAHQRLTAHGWDMYTPGLYKLADISALENWFSDKVPEGYRRATGILVTGRNMDEQACREHMLSWEVKQ